MSVIRERPWGWYETYHHEKRFFMRKLTMDPDEELSLGSHHKRDEIWVVIHGSPVIEIQRAGFIEKIQANKFFYIHIPAETKHRFYNPTDQTVEIAELAFGPEVTDEDIVRYEDKYGRENA
jgi:mannose-6-phosphate isomerase-like protein (cupin superfamily)